MPLDADPVIGCCYLSQRDFAARKSAFGAVLATANNSPEADLALLATASRQIETYLGGRKFDGETVTENQTWNPRTRRFPLNNPPPVTVTACKLWLAPNLWQSITLTPVTQDGAGRQMSWGELIWNRQVNLMEVGFLASANVVQPALVIAGINYPFFEITYTTESVPPEVAAACGFQAAHLAQMAQADDTLPGGLTSVRTLDTVVTRKSAVRSKTGSANIELCTQAQNLLNGLMRLAVG